MYDFTHSSADISSAKLYLYAEDAGGPAGSDGFNASAHMMNKDWTEGTGDAAQPALPGETTWNSQHYQDGTTNVLWEVAGATGSSDRVPTATDTKFLNLDSTGVWFSWDVEKDVEYMYDSTSFNGWLLVPDDADREWVRFRSTQNAQAAFRPYLKIGLNYSSSSSSSSSYSSSSSSSSLSSYSSSSSSSSSSLSSSSSSSYSSSSSSSFSSSSGSSSSNSSSCSSSSSRNIRIKALFGSNTCVEPYAADYLNTLEDAFTEFITHKNWGHSDVVRVGSMSGVVQYDGYFEIDVSGLDNHITSSSQIQWARLYLLSKDKVSGAPDITIQARRVKKDFGAGSGMGSDSTSGEVDWLDARHNELEWQRQWQTRQDKEYIVQDETIIDGTAGIWYDWGIKGAVSFAYNNDKIVRVKLERKRETISGVWDFYSNEESDVCLKPYLVVYFPAVSSSSSSLSSSSRSSSYSLSSSSSSSSRSSSTSNSSSSSSSSP